MSSVDVGFSSSVNVLVKVVGFIYIKYISLSLIKQVIEKIAFWNTVSLDHDMDCLQEQKKDTKLIPQPSPFQLFKTYELTSRSLKLLYAWFAVGLLYFGML